MASEILTELKTRCLHRDGHYIWNGEFKRSVPIFLSFRGKYTYPAAWFYLESNKLESIPKNKRLSCYCEEQFCISHYELLSTDIVAISEVDATDVLWLLNRLQFITIQGDNHCKLVTKLKPTKRGYIRFRFLKRKWFLHRLVYCVHSGEDLSLEFDVAHSCGVRNCVNIHHLYKATKSENAKDKVTHGTDPTGSRNPSAKIDEKTAQKIIDSYRTGQTQKQRAKAFNTSIHIVQDIDRGRTWTHLMTREQLALRRQRKRKRDGDEKQNSDEKRKKNKQTGIQEQKVFFQSLQQLITKNIKEERDEKFPDPHWIWQKSITTDGYGQITISKNPWITGATAHRIAFQIYNEISLPPDVLVRHKCQEKRCCNPKHLEPGTTQDNADDMKRDQTVRKGEKHHSAKITETVASQIKNSKDVASIQERADKFGVTYGHVMAIDRGLCWRDL